MNTRMYRCTVISISTVRTTMSVDGEPTPPSSDILKKKKKYCMQPSTPYWQIIYRQVYPPSTTKSAPVVYVLASLAKYKYTPLSSRGSASRPSGVSRYHSFFTRIGQSPLMAVSMYPGLTLLTRANPAHSTARDLARWITPALQAL